MAKLSLYDYLCQLCIFHERRFGLWVDPQDIDNYRVGECSLEHGGLIDNKVFVGNLEDLSFGCQSKYDAVKAAIDGLDDRKFNKESLLRRYEEGKWDFDDNGDTYPFWQELYDQAEEQMKLQTEWDVDFFISEKLPTLLREDLEELQEVG